MYLVFFLQFPELLSINGTEYFVFLFYADWMLFALLCCGVIPSASGNRSFFRALYARASLAAGCELKIRQESAHSHSAGGFCVLLLDKKRRRTTGKHTSFGRQHHSSVEYLPCCCQSTEFLNTLSWNRIKTRQIFFRPFKSASPHKCCPGSKFLLCPSK